MCSEENKTNHVSCIVSAQSPHDIFFSVKHKDSAFTYKNAKHHLEVCNSPVKTLDISDQYLWTHD